MAKDKEEIPGPEDFKRNLNSVLNNSYDRLLFLSKGIHTIGESGEGILDKDCVVLEDYLMDIARELEEGSKTLDNFDLVAK
ncbi:MAG TPA: hypothetical protein VMW09_00170 [Desulfatiglandales bacterium]|nr:hypothetical protein [Desulfatiglandales bacterium]